MSLKCVHQGCGKTFDEGSDEVCHYHSGPPIFHEGQKGTSSPHCTTRRRNPESDPR